MTSAGSRPSTTSPSRKSDACSALAVSSTGSPPSPKGDSSEKTVSSGAYEAMGVTPASCPPETGSRPSWERRIAPARRSLVAVQSGASAWSRLRTKAGPCGSIVVTTSPIRNAVRMAVAYSTPTGSTTQTDCPRSHPRRFHVAASRVQRSCSVA
ncbi:MAG: hypothetical protein QM820_08960 [Minicystis sp.]